MKKLLVMLLAMVLVLAFAACGAAPAEDTEPEEAAEETAEETTEEPAEEAQPEETSAGIVEVDGNSITLSDDESEGPSNSKGMEKTPLISAHDINAVCQTGPFTVTINKAQLSNINVSDQSTADLMSIPAGETVGLFVIDVTVENTSPDDMGFYPDQSTIVTSTKEQVNSSIWLSDSVGGDFLGQVIKDGQIYFFLKSPADDVTHIQWRVDAPHNSSYESVGDELIVEFELMH